MGGGPSGLAAAHTLARAGWPVTVLDAGPRAGGKLQTVAHDGFVLETGASVVASASTRVRALAAEVGLAGELVPGRRTVVIARNGRLHRIDTGHLIRDAIRTRALSWRGKLRAVRLAADLRRARPLLAAGDLTGAAALDVETPQDYCRRRLDDELYDYAVDSCVRGVNGTSGAEVSVVDFFFVVANVLGSQLLSFRRGTTSYAEALAAGFDVRTSCRVVEVRQTPNSVVVESVDEHGRHRSDEAAGCVVAVPADRVAGMVGGLDADSRQFLDGVRYTASVHLNVGLDRRPRELRGMCIQLPRPVSEGLFAVTIDHDNPAGRAPPDRGLVGLYATSRWSSQLMELDDDTVASRMLAETDRVLPGLAADVAFVRVNRWPSALVQSRPGHYRALAEFARRWRRPGPVQLAGDYLASSNLEGATLAGERAATDLLSALGAPGALTASSATTQTPTPRRLH